MENANFLNQVFTAVQNQATTIDEQIDRLQRAKHTLLDEQTNSMNEINRIKGPSLDSLWEGRRANQFDDTREESFHTMRVTIQNYEAYLEQIEDKIIVLRQQMEYVNRTGSIAHTADQLLQRGEETGDELGTIMQQLQGRVFS